MKRIELLRKMAESINIHDGNRERLKLIIEELDYLHDETQANHKLREDIRRSFQ